MAKPPPETEEERLIGRYFRPLARHPGALGLIDDAAQLTPPPGCDLVLTADLIIGGVHFFADDPPEAIACKALRVNLSDLAAKGAAPAGFLLALALPEGVTKEWLGSFAKSLGDDADAYGCPLFGGDTAKTPGPLMVSITAFGTVPTGSMVRRSGARSGDRIVVTGTIGDAALGLELRRENESALRRKLEAPMRDYLIDRYLYPQPRNALADLLRQHASAAMDVSDGLAGDLTKLCRASAVSADIDVGRVPLSEAARAMLRAEPALVKTILTAGDDYEIVCTMAAADCDAFRSACAATGVAATEIGSIAAGDGGVRVLGENKQPLALDRLSYSHF
jgi:thiamine-monophosphate kinase